MKFDVVVEHVQVLGVFWRIWTKLGGKSSYKPPGASYTAQGPQKQPEILDTLLLFVEQINISNSFLTFHLTTVLISFN